MTASPDSRSPDGGLGFVNDVSLFHEEQRFHQWWMRLSVLLPAAAAWALFFRQVVGGRPVGTNPLPDLGVWLLLAVVGVGLPALLLNLRLVTEVYADRLVVRFWPFPARVVGFGDLADTEVTEFRPIVHYGGWGMRWGFGKGRAWTVSGTSGVRLTMADGRLLLVGSQRAEELDDTLRLVRG